MKLERTLASSKVTFLGTNQFSQHLSQVDHPRSRPEKIMPQTFAIILFLNSFNIFLLFPPLLLFSHYSQQLK